MKKIIVVCIIICFVLVIGFIGLITRNNKTISTITLDINPSIVINLNKDKKVNNIIALNDDAKDIVESEYNNKTLEETFELLITNLIDKGYVNDNEIDVILYTNGKVNNKEVASELEFIFGKKDIHTEVIVIEEITKKDETLAKKYNVSPAKVAYIKTIVENNKNIDIYNLINRSVAELKETKETGNYCDDGYILEGDFCLKEIDRVASLIGEVCPIGYYEYNDNCYEEVGSKETNELACREGFTLNATKCENVIIDDAVPSKYTCSKGEAKTRLELNQANANDGNADEIVCVDYSSATHPISPCETSDGTEYTVYGGKCYWHRAPVIESGCPGKVQIGSMCWDDASNILICEGYRDGKQYTSRSEYCENSIKYFAPIVSEYKCNGDFTLKGTKCEKVETENAWYKRACQSGFTEVDNGICINESNTTKKISGYVCNAENSKVVGNVCVIYEIVEAKSN